MTTVPAYDGVHVNAGSNTAMASGNRTEHIPSLDGLRGYAALLVLVSHLNRTGFLARSPDFTGPAGVMLFFTLSGFLMGHLYLNQAFDAKRATRFTIARIARVLPIFYIVITASFLISRLEKDRFIYFLSPTDYVKHLVFLGSKHVFWSIPPEFEFYFVFLGLWWLYDVGLAKKYLPVMLLTIAVIFIARPIFPGITVFSQIHIFLVGIGVALLRRKSGTEAFEKKTVQLAQVLCVIAVLIVASSVFSIRQSLPASWRSDAQVYGNFPVVLAFGAVLFIFSIQTRFTDLIFNNRFAVRMGAYSFSLYLLHEPVMAAVKLLAEGAHLPWLLSLVLAIIAALLVAAFSYHALEMPLQKLVRGSLDRISNRWRTRRGARLLPSS